LFFTYSTWSGGKKRIERKALNNIVEREKKLIDRMSRERKTNPLMVFIKTAAMPRSALARAQNDLIKHCKRRFGQRFVLLSVNAGVSMKEELVRKPGIPPMIEGSGATEKTKLEKVYTEIREKLAPYSFSPSLSVLRYGEWKRGCPDVANARIVRVLAEDFGLKVPPERQFELKRITFSESEAMHRLNSEIRMIQNRKRKKPRRLRHRIKP